MNCIPSNPGPIARTFEAVQILRGFAAGIVVFHHFCWTIRQYHPQTSWLATTGGIAETGAAGVDVFFCISGLVITHAARGLSPGKGTALTFTWRRVVRVLPMYWLFTAILLAAWVSGKALTSLIMTPQLVLASLFLLPYPKRTIAGDFSLHPILDVGWTLTFEMYFYLLCSLIVFLGGGRRIFPWVFAALAAMAGFALVAGLVDTPAGSILASPMLVEFCGGVLLARFAEQMADWNRRNEGWIGRASLLVGVAGLAGAASFPGAIDHRLLFWGVPGFFLTAGAMLTMVDATRPVIRLLMFVGTASYTVYLAHPLVTLAVGTAMKSGWFHSINPDLLIVFLTLATVLATASTYPFLEGQAIKLARIGSRRGLEPRHGFGDPVKAP